MYTAMTSSATETTTGTATLHINNNTKNSITKTNSSRHDKRQYHQQHGEQQHNRIIDNQHTHHEQ